MIKHVLKEDVLIIPMTSFTEVDSGEIIIYSEKDIRNFNTKEYFGISIEEIWRMLNACMQKEINLNFDKYYLKNSIDLAVELSNINTLVAGSSYMQFGFDENYVSSAINLSLASQDIFYATKLIEKILYSSNKIKNIILGVSYYAIFSDLSMAKEIWEKNRTSQVYYPLLEESHHSVLVESEPNGLLKSSIIDVDKIFKEFCHKIHSRGYFSKYISRQSRATNIWQNKHLRWKELSIDEKIISSNERTNFHNKCINHKGSFKENSNRLKEFADFCHKLHVNLFIVVPPATKYYRDSINAEFKEYFFEAMDSVEHKFVLDLFDCDIFNDDDFVDMDHLDDVGAFKFTKLVIENINKILSQY